MKKSLVVIAAMLGILATRAVAEEALSNKPTSVTSQEVSKARARAARERQPATNARQEALARRLAASGAPKSSLKGLDKNVQIQMEVIEKNGTSVLYNITTSGMATMDSVCGTIEVDGNKLPIIQRIDADVRSVSENEYQVKLIFGQSSPIVTSSTSKTEGETRTTFQYQDVGVETVCRMKLDEKVMIVKSPEFSILLTLQSR